MQSKPILVTLVQAVIDDTASDTQSPRTCRTDEYQTIEQKLTKIVYGEETPIGYSEQSYVISFVSEFI